MTSPAPPTGLLPAPWPHGEGRPWTAGTAVATSVVTAGCALLGAVAGALGLGVVDEDRTADLVLLLLAPAAVLALAGARALAVRRGRGALLAGLGAIAAVLAAAGVLDTEMRTVGIGLPIWLAVCLAPPLISTAFALAPSVGAWLSRRSPPVLQPPPVPPEAATTAAVLGILTGIPAVLLGWLGAAVALDQPSWASPLAVAALLVGVTLLVGARRLLDGHSPAVLTCAAVAAVGVVVGVVLAAVVPDAYGAQDLVLGLVFGLALGLPLPAATLVATLRRPVREWAAGR